MPSSHDAVILAGGRGSRMGHVSKADLIVDHRRLLDTVLHAVSSARTIVVVGDVEVPDGVLRTVEDPPGTGPAAGVAAGLAAVDAPSPWTLLLSVDLPDAQGIVDRLLGALEEVSDDGIVLEADGRRQLLMGCYRTERLRAAFETFGAPDHAPLRKVLTPLRLGTLSPGDAHAVDLDTPEDLARWQRRR